MHEKLIKLKSGVNGAIVVTEAIKRLIDSKIFPKDIVRLNDKSLRTAQRRFKKARKNLKLPKDYELTLREYCVGLELDPIYLAHQLLVQGVKR